MKSIVRIALSMLITGTISTGCLKNDDSDKIERTNAEVSAYTNSFTGGSFTSEYHLSEGMLVKLGSDDDYQPFFFGEIEGFTFERGNEYKLRIKMITPAQPVMDGGNTRYELIEVLSKRRVEYTQENTTLYVSSRTGKEIIVPEHYEPKGIKIRTDETEEWSVVPFNCIRGFEYEEGYDYKLSVVKITLPATDKPKEDALNVQYTLNEIISKAKAE